MILSYKIGYWDGDGVYRNFRGRIGIKYPLSKKAIIKQMVGLDIIDSGQARRADVEIYDGDPVYVTVNKVKAIQLIPITRANE